MIRLGLIGAGRWGRNYIRTVAGLEGVRLTRLASRDPTSRERVGPDCRISADWRELLTAGDLDGLIVATPPALHPEIARAAIIAGIPVLVEKPFTLDSRAASAVRDLARARKAVVMVDHTHLFHPAFEELKRQAARLGAVRAIDTEAGNHGPYRSDVPVLWDWGPHDVAMCLDLLRRCPREVRARREARQAVPGGQAETLRLDLVFGDGVQARIRISNMIAKTRRFAASCASGTLVYDDLAQDKLVLERGGKALPIRVSPEPPLARAVAAFATAIAGRVDEAASLDLAVDVVGVLERCDKALAAA